MEKQATGGFPPHIDVHRNRTAVLTYRNQRGKEKTITARLRGARRKLSRPECIANLRASFSCDECYKQEAARSAWTRYLRLWPIRGRRRQVYLLTWSKWVFLPLHRALIQSHAQAKESLGCDESRLRMLTFAVE